MSAVTCGYCGEAFAEDTGQATCAACPLRGGCQMVRCPRCGYENPVEPQWLTRVRSWLQGREARASEPLQDARTAHDARAEGRLR